MREPLLLVPSLALMALLGPGPASIDARGNARHPDMPHAGRIPAALGPDWMTQITTRIRDAGHGFFPDRGDLRADVPERGLTARFDTAGAHISVGDDDEPAITLRAVAIGRVGSDRAIIAVTPELGDCQEGKSDPLGQCIPRLEYANDALTEWWVAGSYGFEQGWVLSQRPGGEGPVRIDVEVTSADVEVQGSDVRLTGDDGTAVAVGGLRAWDARGEDVPARFERGDEGFRVVVDDEGAVYPVEVDPVYTAPDWSVEGVGGLGRDFGEQVVGIGDVNGDGYDDVAIGGSSFTYVFEGASTGLGTVAAVSWDLVAEWQAAGDVNGDGYDDVLVGNGYDDTLPGAEVFLGGPGGLSTTLSATLPAGTTVAAGDINGDGYDDVVQSSGYWDDDYYGGWFTCIDTFPGSFDGLLTSASMTVCQATSYDQSTISAGSQLAGVGDLNHDGYADVALGIAYDQFVWESYFGGVQVYLGSAAGLVGVGGVGESNSNFGAEVHGVGDVNGDGYDDLTVGATFVDYETFGGETWLYLGSQSGLVDVSDAEFPGEVDARPAGDVNGDGYADVVMGADLFLGSGGGLGSAPIATLQGVSYGVGDTNADGYDDLILPEPLYGCEFTSGDCGSAWVYTGSATAVSLAPTQLGGTDERLGIAVANAGDVNADGFEDLIVGVEGSRGFTGEALVFQGSALGLGVVADRVLVGAESGDYFGHVVSGAGDTNGDGYSDVIVGAYGSGDHGAAYMYAGSATGVAATSMTTISGHIGTDQFGYLVAAVGDVNGDGFADVGVGNRPGVTAVQTFDGSATGTSSTAATTLGFAFSPTSFRSAGDVNGDGFDDVLVGCEGSNSDQGVAYVFYGSSSGTVGSVSTTLRGEAGGDLFGHWVASAGDVNGDGFDDVVVGAPGHDDSAGRVYVYHGAPWRLQGAARGVVDGGSGRDHAGSWVGGAGDLDGDGYDDVWIAWAGYGGTGEVSVRAGSATGVTTMVLARRTGLESLGSGITTGDFDGDGRWDIVIGDPGAEGDAGQARGYYGCVDADVDGYCEAEDCDEADPSIPFAAYLDADRDGYGDASTGRDLCAPEAGYLTDGGDCDDTRASVHPGANERCDDANVDEDCDGLADDDDGSTTGQALGYPDDDGDGYGGTRGWFCDDYVLIGRDCDDVEPAAHPGAIELCDRIDNDCDGLVDEGLDQTWYADADHDRFTDPDDWVVDCAQPEGYSEASWVPDCDDGNASVSPGEADECNGFDDNCDGIVDDGVPMIWCPDSDADGHTTYKHCVFGICQPPGYQPMSRDPDCDDSDNHRYAGRIEDPDIPGDQDCKDELFGACGCSTSPPPALALVLIVAGFVRRRRKPDPLVAHGTQGRRRR